MQQQVYNNLVLAILTGDYTTADRILSNPETVSQVLQKALRRGEVEVVVYIQVTKDIYNTLQKVNQAITSSSDHPEIVGFLTCIKTQKQRQSTTSQPKQSSANAVCAGQYKGQVPPTKPTKLRCAQCNKKLKPVQEDLICSYCEKRTCMGHRNRQDHSCVQAKQKVQLPDAILFPKLDRI
jgi:transglutaminase/protease-like cytokinesis protein 3